MSIHWGEKKPVFSGMAEKLVVTDTPNELLQCPSWYPYHSLRNIDPNYERGQVMDEG
jgi:hypothetical protein